MFVTLSPVNSEYLLDCLLSPDSEDDSDVCQVRISDRGSRQLYADVQIVGVPARGVIDSGSDITIMGGELFRHIATVARLRKNQFHKPDNTPRMYDGRTFTLDGKMDLDITFNGVTMKTPIYIKAQTSEQLRLGEGACRQLQIINYHPDVSDRKGRKWNRHNQNASDSGRQASSRGGVDAPAPIGVEEKMETDTKPREKGPERENHPGERKDPSDRVRE